MFIDGENLVCHYQSMLQKGFVPQPGIYHQPDVYVWHQNVTVPRGHEIIRAYYYTSIVADDVKVNQAIDDLKEFEVRVDRQDLAGLYRTHTHKLYPEVFKKPKKSNKAKVVDIQMTVDILTHVYQDNLDTVCLFSGDGDYKAVIAEVIRRGKQIYIGALSDGFSPTLKQLADVVIDLDSMFIDLNKSPARI